MFVHLRHSAYPDYATHVRFSHLADFGYRPYRFEELNYGPVILKETTTFLKEMGSGERIYLTTPHEPRTSRSYVRWADPAPEVGWHLFGKIA